MHPPEQCLELYTVHMKAQRLFGTENHKALLGSAHPDEYDHAFAKMCCKTHKSHVAAPVCDVGVESEL